MEIAAAALLVTVFVWIGKCLAASSHPCDRKCEWPPAPKKCEYEFNVEWYYTLSKACYDCPYNRTDCARPHCVAANGISRPFMTVNRKLPGPAIKVCHNDTISVIVRNKLLNEEGLTLHWHGIYMDDSPYMDGVPMLTQCPIPSKGSFKYQFKANPPGTHWWHAHSGMHRADGLAGPLIVNRAYQADPHRELYDSTADEHVVFVSDWKHQVMIADFQAYHHLDGSNTPNSWLVNGKGAFKVFSSRTDNSTHFTLREVFRVRKNKAYRFRTISNGFSFCPYMISVDGHRILVIASDGADVEPYSATAIVVHGGERYDFIVNATQNVSNYWINVRGLAECWGQVTKAVLRYEGAPDADPKEAVPTPGEFVVINPGNTAGDDKAEILISKLRPVHSEAYPEDGRYKGTPDQTHFIGWDFMKINNPEFHDPDLYPFDAVAEGSQLKTPQFNNVTFLSPGSPILTQPEAIDDSVLCDPESATWEESAERFCARSFCSCTYVIDVEVGNLVELVLYDEGKSADAGHPMHLHGQHFVIVAMDKVATTLPTEVIKQLHSNGTIQRNFDAPFKDTMIVPDGGYAVIRFIADNPGVWFFHCHIVLDSLKGMELAFRVGKPNDWVKAPSNFPKCGDFTELKWDQNCCLRFKRPCFYMMLFALLTFPLFVN